MTPSRRELLAGAGSAAAVALLPSGPAAANQRSELDALAIDWMKAGDIERLSLGIASPEGSSTIRSYRRDRRGTIVATEGAARLVLAPAPFITAALAQLVGRGALGWDNAVASHLPGIEAYRDDGATPLSIAELRDYPGAVSDWLGSMLIARAAGISAAAHIARHVLRPLGLSDIRIKGAPQVHALDASFHDALHWLQAGGPLPSTLAIIPNGGGITVTATAIGTGRAILMLSDRAAESGLLAMRLSAFANA